MGFTMPNYAQAQTINNESSCDFRVVFAAGDPANCNATYYDDITVAAGTSFTVTLPAGTEIIASKGYPLAVSPGQVSQCVYYIGQCFGYPNGVQVNCNSPCAPYKVELAAGDIHIKN